VLDPAQRSLDFIWICPQNGACAIRLNNHHAHTVCDDVMKFTGDASALSIHCIASGIVSVACHPAPAVGHKETQSCGESDSKNCRDDHFDRA
jgi:hypothetical protein